MTDLKPCPFCAVDMTHSEALSSRNTRRMVHPRNGCVLEGFVLDISRRADDIERADKWNRRSPSPTHVVGEPAYYAVHSKTGMHIGLWPDKAFADEVLREYDGGQGGKITPLYTAPPADALTPAKQAEGRNAQEGGL